MGGAAETPAARGVAGIHQATREDKMAKHRWVMLLSLVIAITMVLSSCTTPTPAPAEPQIIEKEVTRVSEVIVKETVEVPKEIEKEVTPEPVDRTGAWLDTVVVIEEPSADAAVNRMETGEIDVYAYQVTSPDVARMVEESDKLSFTRSFGSYNELTFNPAGPEFADGRLNPFSSAKIREAMNILVDREYIAKELMGGMAVPRWLPLNNASNDYAALADVARKIEFQYAYNKDKAQEDISAEMEALGAKLVDGKWTYNGSPVEIILLIRTEDERRDIGDYVANQLEDIGFTTVRDYKTGAEASPIWTRGDPTEGKFSIYTGGWVTTVVPRNLADNFAFFYTDMGLPYLLWQQYKNDPAFYELAQRLENNDFKNLAERREMMAEALELAMKDSNRIFLVDEASITPARNEVQVAADLYGGVGGAWLWPVTLRRAGEVGGSMTIGLPSILPEPWNPLAGSNWIYDMMLIRGTGEIALMYDPYTGLVWPQRIEKADVVIEEGLPVGRTHDWVNLEFAPKIEVPEDAWVDWDPVAQKFLTAGEVYTETATALRKSVVYYPADLYETSKWHDGSNLSVGDFVMGMILTFDRAKEESKVYDANAVPEFDSFMSAFKGVKITSVDPLVIETYSDLYQLDAEMSVSDWWPYYNQGEGSWHVLTMGLLAEEAGEMAYTAAKAQENDTEWTSFIAGPCMELLSAHLTEAISTTFVPYAPTFSEFVTEEEVAERYANLQEWYRTRGHFWVGTGPYYLERAFPVEGTVILRRFLDYADPATKWERFAAAPIADVELDGPGMVNQGKEAVYEVWVEFNDAPYPADDISEVKYLLFDSAGELAVVDAAAMVEEGLYEIKLTSEQTAKLAEGSTRLEVVVVSKTVAVPSSAALQLVVAK